MSSNLNFEDLNETPIIQKLPRSQSSSIFEEVNGPLLKAIMSTSRGRTASMAGGQSVEGVIDHPFDMSLATRMTDLSPYHGSCQRTLIAATVGCGMGIVDEEATRKKSEEMRALGNVDAAHILPVIDEEATRRFYDFVDPLCEDGFDHLLNRVGGNVFGIGNGYIEMVRRDGLAGPLERMGWLPGHCVWKHQFSEADRDDYAWRYSPYGYETGVTAGKVFYLRKCNGKILDNQNLAGYNLLTHEVLDFRLPTTRWEHYGAPFWLAAGPYIEVDWQALQRVSDYMKNNGVPETLVILGGVRMTPKQQDHIRAALSSGGAENYGRGALLSFPNANKQTLFAEVHQIANSLEGSGWADTHSAVNLCVASANQVPPVLAGITTPGKLAASNESVLAMVIMQTTVVAPVQKYIAQKFTSCLLRRASSPIPGLAGRRLRFRTILESTDIVALNTVARQREQVAESPDRKPEDGLKRG